MTAIPRTAPSHSRSLVACRFKRTAAVGDVGDPVLPFPAGLLAVPPGGLTGARAGLRAGAAASLRTGLEKVPQGGGLSRSTPAGGSGFFSLMVPVLVELPSNTISGLFRVFSLLELQRENE